MANNTKTPAMVVQELTMKKCWPPPEYKLIGAKQGTHENVFIYEVNIRGFKATGSGPSKQIAKHRTALAILSILKENGLYQGNEDTIIIAPKQSGNMSSSSNALTTLRDVCFENKLEGPDFNELSDVGPPHFRQFTYECRVASFNTRATAGTKKQAKQLASQGMLEKLNTVLLHSVEQSNLDSKPALCAGEDKIMEMYKEIRPYTKTKPNVGMKVKQYDSFLYRLIEEKELNINDVRNTLLSREEEDCLLAFSKMLEIDYGITLLNPAPAAFVSLTLALEMPFTIIEKGQTEKEASNKAISSVVSYLRLIFTNM